MSSTTPPHGRPDDAAVTPVEATPHRGAGVAAPRTALGASSPIEPSIIATSVLITVVHLASTVIGVLSEADVVRNGVAVTSVAFFFVGALSFVVAFVVAASRSRFEDLWFGGVFFLTGGVVPARARTILMGCLLLQIAVGLIGASLAPFTPVAFVVLVPLAAMGLMSLYGARWGEFSPTAEAD